METDFLSYFPCVYCVRDKYQIIFITKEAGAGAVIIGGKRYTDNVCGVVRSMSHVHRVEINAELLDEAKRYTVEFKYIPNREPYRPKTEYTKRAEFNFRPVPDEGEINCYIISDTHGNIHEPSIVGQYFGDKLDLLILGGDMGRNAPDEQGLLAISALASNIAGGEVPVIFMRGNHDTRGAFAERLPEYVGTDNGKTYFPIRLGRLWFVILDPGEDKNDDHPDYGDIADYQPMRNEQVIMLEEMIENSRNEYDAEGVELRIALCHVPFVRYRNPCPEIYEKWAELLNKMEINAMLCGHTHGVRIISPEKAMEKSVMPTFPTVECSELKRDEVSLYKGTALTIEKKQMKVRFTDIYHNVISEHIISINTEKETDGS